MPRDPQQGEEGDRANQQGVARLTSRAYGNFDRPRTRQKQVLYHLHELAKLFALDKADRTKAAT